jgi:Flp pilus assembly protein TadD
LELAPHDVDALLGLGWCHIDLEQPNAAITSFERVIALAPQLAEAHLGLAESYRMYGKKSLAREHYNQYLELAPEGSEANAVRRALRDLE